MRTITGGALILVVLVTASEALAGRCAGATGDLNAIIMCEDFDRYCNPPPADPTLACDCRTQDPDTTNPPDAYSLYANWPPEGSCSGSGGATALDGLVYWRAAGDVESWKCHHDPGANQGYMARVAQQDATLGVSVYRHTRDITSLIQASPRNTAQYNYINGTGDISLPLNPDNTTPPNYINSLDSTLRPGALKGRFMMYFSGAGAFSNMIYYTELYLDDDRAPFNYLTTYCPPWDQWAEGFNNPKLILTDNQVHASFALGMVATTDRNPCDLDTGRKPTEWQLAVYDGQNWQTFKVPTFGIPAATPEHGADLMPEDGWNTVSFAIGTDYIEVRLQDGRTEALGGTAPACFGAHPDYVPPIYGGCVGGTNLGAACLAKTDCGDPTVTPANPHVYAVARVERKYKGVFNKVAIGPSKGVDLVVPTCENFGTIGVPVMKCNGGANDKGACTTAADCPAATAPICPHVDAGGDVYVEELALWDGVFEDKPAACCQPDLTCSILAPAACATAGGLFHSGAACTPSPCCHIPPADFDGDGDVDMNDFGVLQGCLNLGGGTLGVGCGCFDTNSNGIIDSTDVENFIKCASGDGVPWVACNP